MEADRFMRSEILYGKEGMEKIREARVLVAGAGAVGGYAIEALARSGVGNFYIADFDVVEFSNINRQILALESTIGLSKTQLARRRILDINPRANVETLDFFIDASNVEKVCALPADVIVDAIDSVSSKVALLECAVKAGRKVVSSMGAARKLDPKKICTADISKSYNCPLAAKIRKQLRYCGIKRGFKCVFSSELAEGQSHVSAPSEKKVIGSSCAITGIFGFMLADLALREIIGGPQSP